MMWRISSDLSIPRRLVWWLFRCAVVGAIVGVWFVWAESPQAAAPRKPLKIYFVDVEGGQSTLFVTLEGQSLLIDTGWPGNAGRDADRIVAAAKNAGLAHLDYVPLTHYHVDHTGGVPQLVDRIPVGTFVDHGPLRETGDKPTTDAYDAYQKVLATKKYKHILAQPGI